MNFDTFSSGSTFLSKKLQQQQKTWKESFMWLSFFTAQQTHWYIMSTSEAVILAQEKKKEDMDMWCSSQQFFTVKPLTATNLYQLPAVARQQWSQRSWFLSLPLSYGMTGMRPPYFLCSQFLWSLLPLPRHHQYEVVAFRGFTEKGCQLLCHILMPFPVLRWSLQQQQT